MATFFSDQVTAYNSTNPLFPSGFTAAQLATFQANVQYGKLRVLRFDYLSVAGMNVADITQFARLPNGKITLYPGLSLVRNGAFGGTATLSLGNAAYRDQLGAVVAASATSLLAATSTVAAGTLSLLQAAPSVGVFSFESMNGVFLTATIGGSAPAAGLLFNGYLVIAVE